jgi:hypothetical protein
MTVLRVKNELRRLRQGQGLAHVGAVMRLTPNLRTLLLATLGEDTADESELLSVVTSAIGSLADDERLVAAADFNLAVQHRFPTLTARQESVAASLGCAAKTILRRADGALTSLALALLGVRRTELPAPTLREWTGGASPRPDRTMRWQDRVRPFWRIEPEGRIDIVCSEALDHHATAAPDDGSFNRYSKFADLDSLVYLRTRLAQVCPDAVIRDFGASEYYGQDAQTLVVVGGPTQNPTCREFLPQLPVRYSPSGADEVLVVPAINRRLGPRRSADGALLNDVAMFARVAVGRDTTVFLVGGCLTLGVMGAAKLFLQSGRGAQHADYLAKIAGENDFVLITEARRVVGITDVGDLTADGPLLLLVRENHLKPYLTMIDNLDRYLATA